MDERIVAVVAALLVCAGACSPVVAADSASPTVDVTVDAAPLDPGETHRTPTDPLVRVSASADAPVSLVELRVDGTTRHAFEPDSKRFERSGTLDLETGVHRLTVVVRADGVATHEATVIKDDEAPVVDYTTPFENASSADDDTAPTELTVNRGNVSVGGDLRDLSVVEAVRVTHTYDYELGNGTERTGTAQHLLLTPGADFRQSLDLVPGSNRVTVFTEDAVGNVREHEFTIAVDDGTAPALTLTDVEWLSPTRLHVEGRVTDRVQVQSIWLKSNATAAVPAAGVTETDGNPTRHPLVFPASTAPNPDRRNVTLDTTIYHPAGADHLVLGANDTAGNERTWNYSLSTFLAPNVTVDDGRTGYVDDRTVAVGGRVVDGQVRDVSVEAVDPETGRIVDIRPVDLGAEGAFDTRLDAAPDETLVRVRVRDASGAEHLTNATVAGALDPTQTPKPTRDAGADADSSERIEASGTGDDVDESAQTEASGLRLPVVGVVVPTPDVGGMLSASVSLPVPFVGPFEVPLLAAGGPLVAVVAAVAARRRGG